MKWNSFNKVYLLADAAGEFSKMRLYQVNISQGCQDAVSKYVSRPYRSCDVGHIHMYLLNESL